MNERSPREYITTHREKLLDSTLELLSIDTSNPPGSTGDIVGLLEDSLDRFPIEVERFAVDPAKPNLLVTVPGEGEGSLLYNGHLDTVPFDGDAWSYDPLGERVDDRIYGRGATDMKGALSAMLFVIQAFAETDTVPPVNLHFAFVSDEEIGGDAGLPALLAADRLAADACVIGEPTCEEGRHSVTVADRGSIWLTLEATGEAAHGSRPVLGTNAIDRLYHAVQTIRDRFGGRTVEIDPAMEPIVEESVEFYAPTMGADTVRDLLTQPSINLGTFEGGSAINSVPQSATAEIDIRLIAGVETAEMLSEIRACADECVGVTIVDVSWSVGTAEPVDSPLVDALVAVVEDVTGTAVYRRSATGGGDAKRLRNAGIPTVEFALGTDTVHAVDEYTTGEALVGNARIYARLPYQLSRAGWPGTSRAA